MQRQVGSRFCNRHGDEAGDVADCFSLHWFFFRVSSLKINNIAPEKARFHPKSTDIFLISARKHMMWVLIRSAEATTYVSRRNNNNMWLSLYVKFSLFLCFHDCQ